MNYTPCNGCIAVLFQLYHYQLASDLFPGIGFPVHCARKGMQNRGKFTLYIKLPCILCSYSSSWMVGHLLELGLPYYLITSTPLCVKKKKDVIDYADFSHYSAWNDILLWVYTSEVLVEIFLIIPWIILPSNISGAFFRSIYTFYIRFPFSVFHSFYIFLYKFFPLFISFVLSILDPWWWFHIKFSYCLKRFF